MLSQFFPGSKKDCDRKIKELANKAYLPEPVVSLVASVTNLQLDADALVAFTVKNLLPEETEKAIAGPQQHSLGAPLLLREKFPLDMVSVSSLARDILSALASTTPELAPLGEKLTRLFASEEYSLEGACRELLAESLARQESSVDRPNCFSQWELDHPDSPHFFRFIAVSSITPSVRAVAQLLAPRHDSSTPWQYGHCPLCGSLPLMGRLKGKEGARHHTCSFCSFEYRVPRLGCPFCLTEQDVKNNYFVSDEEPGYQIYVCQKCREYIKIADFREFDRPYVPMLDDLGSLVLDIYAKQMGYTRPTLSAWGF